MIFIGVSEPGGGPVVVVVVVGVPIMVIALGPSAGLNCDDDPEEAATHAKGDNHWTGSSPFGGIGVCGP